MKTICKIYQAKEPIMRFVFENYKHKSKELQQEIIEIFFTAANQIEHAVIDDVLNDVPVDRQIEVRLENEEAVICRIKQGSKKFIIEKKP